MSYESGELHGSVRWCAGCGHDHGPLFVCSTYPPELQAQLHAESEQARINLNDPAWIAEQRANGVSDEALGIMRWFMGDGPEQA